jgi:hypothetical protein
MADLLKLDEDTIVGKLHRFWSWVTQQSRDGNAAVTLVYIDRCTQCNGFAKAMVEIGWLRVTQDGHIQVPKFDRHMSEGAKARALTALRVRRYRRNACVPKKKRLEKRREEKSNKPFIPLAIPANLQTENFLKWWDAWEKHRSEIKKPMTPTSAETLLKRLNQWGETRAVAAIEFTISKGWQGLREPGRDEANQEPDGLPPEPRLLPP